MFFNYIFEKQLSEIEIPKQALRIFAKYFCIVGPELACILERKKDKVTYCKNTLFIAINAI